MATLERLPVEGFEKVEGEDWTAYAERTRRAMEALEKASRSVLPASKDLKGALVRWQVADGYAVYVVSNTRPLRLRHVPYMDEYQADAATIRGTTEATVRRQVAANLVFSRMADGHEEFYASLKVGQVVHYMDSRGCYERCEVVRGRMADEPGVPEQNVLRPVALVGAWREFDLPRRDPDGTVDHRRASSVIKGQLMTPHASNIYEFTGFSRRGEPDPSKMDPIPLDVPEMTPEQLRTANLWHEVEHLRAILNSADPATVLASVIREARDNTLNWQALIDGGRP